MPDEGFSYCISGLRIRSQVPLLPRETACAEHDVTISFGAVPTSSGQDTSCDHWCIANVDAVKFGSPGVAKFLVRNGSEVVIQPEDRASMRAIRPFLLGSTVGYLLHQRGKLPLHASCVAVGEGCVVFLGKRRAGKSTLAAFLNSRGYPVLCDDISAVRFDSAGIPVVDPGYPSLKMWSNSLEALGYNPQTLKQVAPHLEKYKYPVDDSFASDPRPLKRIYLLQQGEMFRVREMRLTDAFKFLRRFTYRRGALREMGHSQSHFSMCTRLAQHVPMMSFTRPRDLSRMGECIELLERDFEALSAPA